MGKHTPEPWTIDSSRNGFTSYVCIQGPFINGSGNPALCWIEANQPADVNEANANRIVQCVNACAGIDDPDLLLRTAREALKAVADGGWCKLEDGGYRVVIHAGAPNAIHAALALFPKEPAHD